MRKWLFIIGILFCLFYSINVFADCRGCCSRHGGVICRDGVTMCADGTPLSVKCTAKACDKCFASSSNKSLKVESTQSSSETSQYKSIEKENNWQGSVLAVVDGDTINVMHNGSPEKIRLYGIDAPEKNQEYGSEATVAIFKIVNGMTVEIKPTTKDKYGRTVAWVYVGSKCVNEELLKEGLAWHYKKYSSDKNLADFEETARKNKIGLWADPNPLPPWDFRHGKNTGQEKESETSETSKGDSYHGNIDSKIFHKPGCQYYNCKNCVSIFSDRNQAVEAGYRPCRIYNP